MPSQLNRIVFRSLLADKPLFYRGCLYRLPRTRPRPQPQPHAQFQHQHECSPRPLLAAAHQRRTFLDLFKPRRKVKDAEVPPGLDVMADLVYHLRDALRPPPPTTVAKAMSSFFAQKRGTMLESFHVQIVLKAFQYLLENPRADSQPWFSPKELGLMLDKLMSWGAQSGGELHLALGRLLDAELKRLRQANEPAETAGDETPQTLGEYERTDLINLIRLLTQYGTSLEAREIMVGVYGGPLDSPTPLDDGALLHEIRRQGWACVLHGLAREDNEAELLATLDLMQELSIPFGVSMQEAVVLYFVDKKQVQQANKWYSQPLFSADGIEALEPSHDTLVNMVKVCALQGELAIGQQIVNSLLKKMPRKEGWDAILLWSAAIGKGPDEIDRMMNVMVRRNTEERQKNPSVPLQRPDITTINLLVEFSMSKQDSYSAERYVTLGEKRGIYPNERTFTLQIQYRLSINDIDGARAAYFGLQGDMTDSDQSVAAVNALIQAMCQSQQHQFDDIMVLVDDLHERKARLAPKTVAILCMLHLRRGEAFDAMDLVQVHAHSFSPQQRVVIRKDLAAFIMDDHTSTADAWDSYQILRNCFPETPRSDRIPILNEFVARKRSDMACHVFFHMRNSTEEDITTTKEVYVAAFTGFARNKDAESLELAHNQLKLDLNVELDTQLRNALMLAYAETKNNRRALELWAEIGSSKEGPTYNSIPIAFRSCEGMPFGDEHAKSIWRRLKEMDVEIDKKIFTAYLGAIARNQRYDEALALIESGKEEYGFTPDLFILGNLFNTTTHIDRQAKLEVWMRQNYPFVWAEIEALGFWVTSEGFGYRQYNFNRDLDP